MKDDRASAVESALAALKRGEWPAAYEAFKVIGQEHPDEERAFIFAAEALFGEGKSNEAFAHLDAVASRFRERSPWSDILLGKIELARGESAAAIARFRGALERFPDRAEPFAVVAEVLREAGLTAEADQFLASVGTRLPDRADVWRGVNQKLDEVYGLAPSSKARLRRSIVIVYGSCQAHYLTSILNSMPSLAAKFTFVPVLNHAALGEEVAPIPADAAEAVLLWEQYEERANAAVRNDLRATVPDDCAIVTFPPVIYMSPWPFAWMDPRNLPEPNFPFGRYPWGDRVGIEIANMNLPEEAVVDAYMELARKKMPDVKALFERDRVVSERRDSFCDVKITPFMSENFRTKQLMWTWGHITSAVGVELVRQLWQHSTAVLGELTPERAAELERAGELLPGDGREQLPIHPDVIRDLDLRFTAPDGRYSWYGERWTFSEYIKRYIMFDQTW